MSESFPADLRVINGGWSQPKAKFGCGDSDLVEYFNSIDGFIAVPGFTLVGVSYEPLPKKVRVSRIQHATESALRSLKLPYIKDLKIPIISEEAFKGYLNGNAFIGVGELSSISSPALLLLAVFNVDRKTQLGQQLRSGPPYDYFRQHILQKLFDWRQYLINLQQAEKRETSPTKNRGKSAFYDMHRVELEKAFRGCHQAMCLDDFGRKVTSVTKECLCKDTLRVLMKRLGLSRLRKGK